MELSSKEQPERVPTPHEDPSDSEEEEEEEPKYKDPFGSFGVQSS